MVPDGQNALPAELWRDSTLRQVVRLSLGGKQLRVRVSNVFGTQPLVIDGATVARAVKHGAPDLVPGSVRPLRFGGRPSVMIPAGAEYYSDAVDLPVEPGADLAISLHYAAEPARQTGHPGARTYSFLVKGSQAEALQWTDAQKFTRWYQLADVEVLAPAPARAVVAIGDSITDGYGVTIDGNDRWTDFLATRLTAGKLPVGVVNAGIGGGRLLRDGLGPNLVSRFDRDVLGRGGVSHAIIMIGVNDFGIPHRNKEDTPEARARLLEDLKQAHRQLVERAHAKGVCVIGATITPYIGSGYYQPNADNEKDRQDYNQWIRQSGVFDGVADFDAALRDPAKPEQLLKAYDNDGLHPSIAGYKAMAEAVPLAQLASCRYATPVGAPK
jgi:lysophospholipase L1-like esterase